MLLILVTVFTLVACEQDNTGQIDEGEGTIELKFDTDHYSEDMVGVTLNLYGVTDNVRPILDVFEEDTGIKVEHLTMKNGEILQRLENEKESGVNIADLWFTGGADTFINAAENDLLEPYITPEATNLSGNMKDSDGYWHGTSLTLVNWIVNRELITENDLKMPSTWEDLLQEGLKGEVSMSNPASSGTAYNVVTAILQTKGEEEGWNYLDKLIEQVPFFTARGSDPQNLVVNGEAIVGINASNGDFEVEEQYEHIEVVYPEDGTGWWPQPVAIVSGTDNIDEAKVFIDWIISKRGMEVVAEKRYAAVARTDVDIPEGIVDINDIALFPADFKAGAENRDTILEIWGSKVD
jgi:iron(III) transport system substrate-binding protein